ncbi:MAG TPA: hypothetical protein VMS98_03925, partial [Thermoanaerobaculia bacterium]|nr:hypothetical protein [Thermoanaerobaculia bacterium]
LPFEGKTAADVLTRHLTQEPPSLRSLNGNLSHATAQAIERCLAKDPAKRWPDARSLKLALGASEETHLPDALHAVEGRGVPGLIIVMIWIFGFWLAGENYGWWKDDGGRTFLALSALTVSAIYGFLLARMKREGFQLEQAQAAIWREPSWWLWWYPKAWRRRGNVWERLLSEVRLLRSILPLVWVALPIVVTALLYFANVSSQVVQNWFWVGSVATTLAVWIVASVRTRRELTRKGLTAEDLGRVMYSAPPSRVSYWQRPHIAAILAPATDEDRETRADSAHGHFQSILRYAGELSGALRPLGAEAAAAARQLLASIEDADREIAELARTLEAGEEERLNAKIAALQASDSAPLRTLYEKELELVRGLSERIEEAKEARNRRMEMLKTLALHLAALRARSAESPETSSVTDRVRALCDDIAAQAGAGRA